LRGRLGATAATAAAFATATTTVRRLFAAAATFLAIRRRCFSGFRGGRSGGGDGEVRRRGRGRGDRKIGVARGQHHDRDNDHGTESGQVVHPVSELTGQLLHRASPIHIIGNGSMTNGRIIPDLIRFWVRSG
jgi:hypothetical protein